MFKYKDKVVIDGKIYKTFYITTVSIRGDNISYEVSGMEDGTPQYFIIEDWRITSAPNYEEDFKPTNIYNNN